MAEQNLISVATGLALTGQRVVTYSIGSFALLRCADQFRAGPVTHRLNVTLVCGGAGLSYGVLGFSHFALEDIAFLRALPNVRILTPTTAAELDWTCSTFLAHKGPQYLRLERACCEGGFASLLDEPRLAGRQMAIVGYGAVMSEALVASDRLRLKGIDAALLSVPVIDGSTGPQLAAALAGVEFVVTVEEHSRRGGLGSLVAEILATSNTRTSLRIIGTDDSVLACWGSLAYIRRRQGLDADAIAADAASLVCRRDSRMRDV